MIMDNNIFPTKKLVEGISGYDLLESGGYVKQISSGFFVFLPLGTKLVHNISNMIRDAAYLYGFGEVDIPALQDIKMWQQSGRIDKYGNNFFTVLNSKGSDYVLAPTHEEAILNLYNELDLPDNSLPWKVFRIGECMRDETRPAFNLIRSKSFILADFYTLCKTKDATDEVVKDLKEMVVYILNSQNLKFEVAQYLKRPNVWSFWTKSKSHQCMVALCETCNRSFRNYTEAEDCPYCHDKNIKLYQGIEFGDVAASYDSISAPLGIKSKDGQCIHLAFAGIGVSRMVQILAEQNHDDRGLVLPYSIAPYRVHIIPNEDRKTEALKIYNMLTDNNIEAILDVRDISLGRKFIDADLIGCPIHITLGNKTAPDVIELKNRLSRTTYQICINCTEEILHHIL